MAIVHRYAQLMLDGTEFPPIFVVRGRDHHFMAIDGARRVLAAVEVGYLMIPARW
jgi:hypothetical protein